MKELIDSLREVKSPETFKTEMHAIGEGRGTLAKHRQWLAQQHLTRRSNHAQSHHDHTRFAH